MRFQNMINEVLTNLYDELHTHRGAEEGDKDCSSCLSDIRLRLVSVFNPEPNYDD